MAETNHPPPTNNIYLTSSIWVDALFALPEAIARVATESDRAKRTMVWIGALLLWLGLPAAATSLWNQLLPENNWLRISICIGTVLLAVTMAWIIGIPIAYYHRERAWRTQIDRAFAAFDEEIAAIIAAHKLERDALVTANAKSALTGSHPLLPPDSNKVAAAKARLKDIIADIRIVRDGSDDGEKKRAPYKLYHLLSEVCTPHTISGLKHNMCTARVIDLSTDGNSFTVIEHRHIKAINYMLGWTAELSKSINDTQINPIFIGKYLPVE